MARHKGRRPAARPKQEAGARTPARLERQEGGETNPSRARSGTTRMAAAAPGGGPRPVGGKGLSLGMKFALFVAGLIAVIVLFWGWTVSRLTKDRLEEQVILKGVETAKALALHGRTLLQSEAEGKAVTWTGLGELGGKRSDLLDVVLQKWKSQKAFTMREEPMGVRVTEKLQGREEIEIRRVVAGAGRGSRRAIEIRAPVKGPAGRLGTVRVLIDARRVDKVLSDLWWRITAAGLIFLAIGAGASIFLGERIARPAKILVADMERVAEGDYAHGTEAVSGDEIGRIAAQFNYMTFALRSLREKGMDFEHQLDAAGEIQASLLPKKIPQLPGYDVFPFYRSAKEVGGDYYDFFPIDREHLAMVVADVSGKGVPGSMVMATTRTTLRILGPQCRTAGETLRQTNRLVARGITRGMFVTVIFAVLNVRAREMTVCSAGHNPMVIYRERSGQCDLVNPPGIALGFDEGPIFERTLKEHSTQLELGDRVVMYTDGVVEAMDPKQEEYGDERFYAFVRDHARMRSKDFAFAVVRDLDQHKGNADQHDDITISTFRVTA